MGSIDLQLFVSHYEKTYGNFETVYLEFRNPNALAL